MGTKGSGVMVSDKERWPTVGSICDKIKVNNGGSN